MNYRKIVDLLNVRKVTIVCAEIEKKLGKQE